MHSHTMLCTNQSVLIAIRLQSCESANAHGVTEVSSQIDRRFRVRPAEIGDQSSRPMILVIQ